MGGLAQNVQKPPPGKNVQKSQGQIFQECQGQIPKVKFPRSNISGMPRSNSQGQIPKVKWETGKKLEKWESVTKIKNQKHLKRY